LSVFRRSNKPSLAQQFVNALERKRGEKTAEQQKKKKKGGGGGGGRNERKQQQHAKTQTTENNTDKTITPRPTL
jgi:hypothetical protein